MTATEKLFRKIDWKLLRAQKRWLLEAKRKAKRKCEVEVCEGLLALLDAIQDCAVDDLNIPEAKVFGRLGHR